MEGPAPQEPLLPSDALHEEVSEIVKKKTFDFEGRMYFIGSWAVIGKIKDIESSITVTIAGIQGPLKASEEWSELEQELSAATKKTATIELEDYPHYLLGDLCWEGSDGEKHILSERLVKTGFARVCSPCTNLEALINIEESEQPPAWHTKWGSPDPPVPIQGRVSAVLSGDFIELSDFRIPQNLNNAAVDLWLTQYKDEIEANNVIRFKLDNIKTPDFSNPLQEHYKFETYQLTTLLTLGKVVECRATTGWKSIEQAFDEISLDPQDTQHLRGSIYLLEKPDPDTCISSIAECTDISTKAMKTYMETCNEFSVSPMLAAASSTEGEAWCELLMPEEFMCPRSPDHLSCLLSSKQAGIATHSRRQSLHIQGREGLKHVLTSLKWVIPKSDFINSICNQQATILKIQKEIHHNTELAKATITVEYKRSLLPTREAACVDDDGEELEQGMIDPESHLYVEDVNEIPVDEFSQPPVQKQQPAVKEPAATSEQQPASPQSPTAAVPVAEPVAEPDDEEEHIFHFDMEVFLLPAGVSDWKSAPLPKSEAVKPHPMNVPATFTFVDGVILSGKYRLFATATDTEGNDVFNTYRMDSSYSFTDKSLLTCSSEWIDYEQENLSLPPAIVQEVRAAIRELTPPLAPLATSYYSFSPRIIKPTKNRQLKPRPKKYIFDESIKDFPGKIPRLDRIIFDQFPLHSNLFARSTPDHNKGNSNGKNKLEVTFLESGMLDTLCNMVLTGYRNATDTKTSTACILYADENDPKKLFVSTKTIGIRKRISPDEEVTKFDDNIFSETFFRPRILHKIVSFHYTTQPLWAGAKVFKTIDDPMHDPPFLNHHDIPSMRCPMRPLIFKDNELFTFESKGLELFRRTEQNMQTRESVSKLYKHKSQGRTTIRIYGGKQTQKDEKVPSQVAREYRNAAIHLLRILNQRSLGFPVEGCFFTWHTQPYDRVTAIYLFRRKHLWLRALEKQTDSFCKAWPYDKADAMFASLVSLWEQILTISSKKLHSNKANVGKLLNARISVTPASPVIDIDFVAFSMDEDFFEARKKSPPMTLQVTLPANGDLNAESVQFNWITDLDDDDDDEEGWEDDSDN